MHSQQQEVTAAKFRSKAAEGLGAPPSLDDHHPEHVAGIFRLVGN
jgi:hypothetical protein